MLLPGIIGDSQKDITISQFSVCIFKVNQRMAPFVHSVQHRYQPLEVGFSGFYVAETSLRNHEVRRSVLVIGTGMRARTSAKLSVHISLAQVAMVLKVAFSIHLFICWMLSPL
jgi:hypothetical protein